MSDFRAVILAAGKGTRMKSALPKVLHKVGGRSMLEHVMDAAEEAGCEEKVVVIGHGAEKVKDVVEGRGTTVLQKEQLGTGHAVLTAASALEGFKGTVLILCGDTPLLEGKELAAFCKAHKESGAKATVMTAIMENPFGYGRIVRDEKGNVKGIVEQKDATEAQKAIKEINSGIYCVEAPLLFDVLSNLGNSNAQGEYYLTDVISILNEKGEKTGGIVTDDSDMIMGINSRRQLAEAEKVMNRRVLDQLMDDGVTVMDTASVFVEKGVKVGQDTILYPFTWLQGDTVIGENCEVGPNVRMENVKMGNDCHLQFAYAHDCEVKNSVTAGPYVHLRPDTVVADKVKIGNFVEIKNSNVGEGSKLPHLQYIGDSDIGKNVNMGCGCITVNYDSKFKHRTVIEDNAFVGCNSNLVAPVTVGAGSYVAAGSTITKEVPADALGVARGKQRNIEGWAVKFKERLAAQTENK